MRKAAKPIIILFLAFLFLYPVLATITGAFMTPTEIASRYPKNADSIVTLIPDRITLNQYCELLIENYKYLNMFWNSVLLSVSTTLLSVVISVLTAYVFAKLEFKGRDSLFFIYIVVMMMPFQVTLLPVYMQSRLLHIYNTYFAIILPGIFAPFGVFLLRQFMKYIPDEFLEAVSLESNSVWDTLKIAVIPAIKPGIIALLVLNFAENWNMVEQPIILLKDPLKYPLSTALNSIIEKASDIAFAGAVVYMIPIIILYFYFEEHIIKGLTNMKF